MNEPIRRLTRFAITPATDDTIGAVFSDDSVARDGNIFLTAGMQTDNFQKNPVVIYCHDVSNPPVGRVATLTKSGHELRGTVQFTPADLNPFGAMVGRMYAEGWLNAFSVSILPLEWRYSTDKARSPGDKDITKSDLLEISAVAVPALTTALVTARSFGVNTAPAARWAEESLDRRDPRSPLLQLCAARKAAVTPTIYHFISRKQ